MPSNTNTSDFANGSVTLDAQVVRWDDSQIEISYTLDNQSTDELVVFDSSVPGASSVLVDGVLRLFRAKYNSGITFVTTPLLGGRLLPAGESISGAGTRPVPVTITFHENTIAPVIPESIEFCIGFCTTDDMGAASVMSIRYTGGN
jgi:hypothetical protein